MVPDKEKPVLDDALHAPVVYFDTVPAFGLIKGVVAITLAAGRWQEVEGEVKVVPAIVGHLRMTPDAAAMLRDALDKALLASAKVKGPSN